VNAALLNATRAGATSAQLYAVAKNAYAAAGMPGEELLHSTQGGATGYAEREWGATPNGTEIVLDRQDVCLESLCKRAARWKTLSCCGTGRSKYSPRRREFPSV